MPERPPLGVDAERVEQPLARRLALGALRLALAPRLVVGAVATVVHDLGVRLRREADRLDLNVLKLRSATDPPHAELEVKPLPVGKSHQQHLGYTTWWEFRGGGEASPRKVNY